MKTSALVSAVLAVTATLVAPAVAEAKLCVRITAPATATRAEPVRVSVTTLMPTWKSGRPVSLRPVAATVRLRVVLEGPKGEYRIVALRRVAARLSIARATIRLASAGAWRLSVSGWEYAPHGCAPPALVRVG